MQIVINMPEEVFESVKRYYEQNQECYALCAYIASGTPLPEGHGRLIDADYATKLLLSLPENELSTAHIRAMLVMDIMPTIIEADKEEETW